MRPVYWWGDPWGARGAILFGAVTAVLMAAAAIASGAWSPAYLALGVLITFVVVAAWVLLVGLVVRWFQARRNWPWRLRVMAVLAVALGLPVAVILTLQAIAGSH
jgi:MFS family permease